MTTGEWFVLIPLNQGLFLNDLRIWRGDGRGVLIPLNQGLFLNSNSSVTRQRHPCLNPFESGSVFKLILGFVLTAYRHVLIPLNQGLFLNWV